MVMKIKRIEIDGKLTEESNLNKFICDNVTIAIDNSNISVKSNGEKVSFVKVLYENIVDGVVLSDAWERAYGDLCWHIPCDKEKMPWYFAAKKDEKLYCFGVKTGANAFCYWSLEGGELAFTIDVRNGTSPLLLDGVIDVCSVVYEEYSGDIFDALSAFCGKMCEKPRLPSRQIFGGNDWYCNYGDNSFGKILTHAKRIVECSKNCTQKPYMVIDDGWEICHHQSDNDDEFYNGGPWRYANDNFGDMKKMAEAIEEEGAIPGLWLRPLLTIEKYPKEYLLKSKGIKDVLDPSHPMVLKLIERDVKTIKEWGYKLIKHDFTSFDVFGKWGFEMTDDMCAEEIAFYDKTKTTAQIIKKLYETIKNAAGEDVLVMGCNTISHLSAGIFELQRTGDDTSGLDFERTKKYGVNTLAFRMCQHNKFYAVDADCVGITNHIEWEKNKEWMDVLSKSGTPLFISIGDDCYSDKIKEDISRALENADKNDKVSKPLDWFDTKTPKVWESSFGTEKYSW